MDLEAKRALAEVRKLEQSQPLSRADLVRIHRDSMDQAEKLRSLLKPAWFVLAPSRKKKSL